MEGRSMAMILDEMRRLADQVRDVSVRMDALYAEARRMGGGTGVAPVPVSTPMRTSVPVPSPAPSGQTHTGTKTVLVIRDAIESVSVWFTEYLKMHAAPGVRVNGPVSHPAPAADIASAAIVFFVFTSSTARTEDVITPMLRKSGLLDRPNVWVVFAANESYYNTIAHPMDFRGSTSAYHVDGLPALLVPFKSLRGIHSVWAEPYERLREAFVAGLKATGAVRADPTWTTVGNQTGSGPVSGKIHASPDTGAREYREPYGHRVGVNFVCPTCDH